MRYGLLFILAVCTAGCFGQNVISSNVKKLEWLTGTWNRTNMSKPNRTAYETWNKVSDNEIRGHGAILQGKDTVFIERFSILVKDNTLYYIADVPENKRLVYFKFTSISDFGFECENPGHDFPKKIVYQFDGDTLKAQISGNGKSIDYLFKRQ
jgi:hypothetical protein